MTKKIIIAGILATGCLLIRQTAKSQVLQPDELIAIHHTLDSGVITTKLDTKGYKTAYGWDLKGREKVNNWIFQTQPGETADLTVRKVTDPAGKIKTLYWISNSYQYKEFMGSLSKSKFRYDGIRIIDDFSYSVFKRGNESLLALQLQGADKKMYYEIRLD
ncbi:hypothetical protein HQ865_00225 [Mucilaginibacter mali]|uniref:Uncharacterized protein n=1 Tax=Mucilaginibacter mali TaxID=2740462 RepID=A0A7D4PRI9_9SPHI|nr:hypothetical protein [Mucilaginibacter mali]QKJ28248.1 hypothetical protein HQ865_00225 [Mucilaginibacter mali]